MLIAIIPKALLYPKSIANTCVSTQLSISHYLITDLNISSVFLWSESILKGMMYLKWLFARQYRHVCWRQNISYKAKFFRLVVSVKSINSFLFLV